jgi:hypothetical protein
MRLTLLATAIQLMLLTVAMGDFWPTVEMDEQPPVLAAAEPDRVVIFIADNCPPCHVLMDGLTVKGGPFTVLRKEGWHIGSGPDNHIQVIPVELSDLDERLSIDATPSLVCVVGGRIVRRLQPGCGTRIDQWSLGWLQTGKRTRPPTPGLLRVSTTGHYPIHGQRWNFEGMWSPSKSFMIRHLLNGSAHRGKFRRWNLQSWSKAELWSLHDDDHEGRVRSRSRSGKSKKTASSRRSTIYCPT